VVHQVANVPEPFAAQLALALVRRQVLSYEPLGREHARALGTLQVPSALQAHLLGHRPSPFRCLYWSLLPLNLLLLWPILVTPYSLLCSANDEMTMRFSINELVMTAEE